MWAHAQHRWIFSDIPANTMYQFIPDGEVSVFRADSFKANGNTISLNGNLVTAEHFARGISETNFTTAERVVLVNKYQEKQLTSPNDVVVSSKGVMYFTDSSYGSLYPSFGHGNPVEQPGNYVYKYTQSDNSISAVEESFLQPNGLAFNLDESKLYISDSNDTNRHIRVFNVTTEGSLEGGDVFATPDEGLPDGIKVDNRGNLWSSAGNGVQVFNPDGTLIAKINVEEGANNLAFGGEDGRDVMMTSFKSVYIIKTKVCGAPLANTKNAKDACGSDSLVI